MNYDRGGRYGALVSWWVGLPETAMLIEPARVSGCAEGDGWGRVDACRGCGCAAGVDA